MIDGCTPIKRLRLKEWIKTQPDYTLFTKTHCKLNSIGNWKWKSGKRYAMQILYITYKNKYNVCIYMPVT